MIINHNIAALNTYRQLSSVNTSSSRSLEKLSSGLRINRAGDDAAGLAVSEKMRGQIRGLEQASRNAQDGISLLQTAEGALNETQSILQRIRELAVQASNDTATSEDRAKIQQEVNQLSSEINRIGNTTEFNTQNLLKGTGGVTGVALDATSVSGMTAIANGGAVLSGGAAAYKTQTAKNFTAAATSGESGNTLTFTIQGIDISITFADAVAAGTASGTVAGISGATLANDATAIATALDNAISGNATLSGNYTVRASGTNVVIEAVAGGDFDGAAGVVGSIAGTGTGAISASGISQGADVAAVAAAYDIDLSSVSGASGGATQTNIEALVGQGWTIAGQQVEFYNSQDGAYTGDADLAIDISQALASGLTNANITDVLANSIATQIGSNLSGVSASYDTGTANTVTITASTAGTAGNSLVVGDGAEQTDTTDSFSVTFQVGSNQGQSLSVSVDDMRSEALGIASSTAATGFTSAATVTDGTTSTLSEYALDVSSQTNASNAIDIIDDAINTVSAQRSQLGAYQNRLEHTINNLGTAAENLTAAESRVRDVDMAKEMMNFTKNNIISQAATAMLAQANQQPQQVLQLLR